MVELHALGDIGTSQPTARAGSVVVNEGANLGPFSNQPFGKMAADKAACARYENSFARPEVRHFEAAFSLPVELTGRW
jgi:hypothetical protein